MKINNKFKIILNKKEIKLFQKTLDLLRDIEKISPSWSDNFDYADNIEESILDFTSDCCLNEKEENIYYKYEV